MLEGIYIDYIICEISLFLENKKGSALGTLILFYYVISDLKNQFI